MELMNTEEEKSTEKLIDELQTLLNDLKGRLVGKTLCPTEFFTTTQEEVKTEEPAEYYGPVHISRVPSVGTLEEIGNRQYKWTERPLPPENCAELGKSLKPEEAIKFNDIFVYHNGKEFVKLYRKNITPRPRPEGGEKFPTPQQNTVLTHMMSEKAVEASAQKFIKETGL